MGRAQLASSPAGGPDPSAPTPQELPTRASPDADLADRELFQSLVAGGRPPRAGRGAVASVLVHAIGLAALILAPLWTSVTPPPTERDYIRVLLYDPPPPPPPPLPKGRGLVSNPVAAREESKPETKPAFTAPVEVPRTPEPEAPEPAVASDTGGSPTGSELGVPEGMEGGQVGGVVGGVPGGVLGGVIGGTGSLPVAVTGFDRPPRLLRMVKPDYPSEAFVKKIQGVVAVEILIDAEGRVVRARVTRSIPELDEAALAAVRQWTFSAAVKGGRPVATLALAPVTFTLY